MVIVAGVDFCRFSGASLVLALSVHRRIASAMARIGTGARKRHARKQSMADFRIKPHVFIASMVGAALVAGAVCAQTAAPAAMKPKKPAPSSTIVIVVTNSRDVALTELDATPNGTFIPKAIARNIAPGKKASANVATDKDCVFDLHGIYADGSKTESTGVDLCKDKSVNLVN
jgi:hypothetical protein